MARTMTRSETAFTHEQFAEAYPDGIENHFWYVARNGIVSDTIQWIEGRQQRRIGKMLEIGCGRGIVVEYLRRTGRDCYGVELSPVTVPDAVQDHVWSATDCLDLPDHFRREVDLILLLDVIEHIEDSVGFLAGIRQAYPNCPWLIISVPARMELWSNFDQAYGHFRRYDEVMLRRELAQAGAELLRSRYRFVLLYPVIYALLRSGRDRSLSNRTPGSPLLHRLLGEAIRRETWLCPRWLYGSSIVGVGRFPEREQ
jgi:predicted TPR repeat methyltransferase